MNPEADTVLKRIDEYYEAIADRIRDMQDRKNRGALIVEVIDSLEDSEEPPASGDMIEVVSADGKLKQAEVLGTSLIMAFHPDYGPVPCVKIVAEITDPDRMTLDDFESLYGEEEEEGSTQEEAQVLGPICECGANRSDCNLSQEYFGVHLDS